MQSFHLHQSQPGVRNGSDPSDRRFRVQTLSVRKRSHQVRNHPPHECLNGSSSAYLVGMEQLFCSYRNTSDRMIIVRCCGPENFYLERVVFPFELLSFHCPTQSDVQIWSKGARGAELTETLDARILGASERSSRPRPEWLPARTPRTVGVRDNASAVSVETI